MSYDSAYGRGSGRWREEAAKCQRGENFPLPLLMHTHEGARDAFQEQGDNVDRNGHTPEIAASFKISTLESFINLDTQARTHTHTSQRVLIISQWRPSESILSVLADLAYHFPSRSKPTHRAGDQAGDTAGGGGDEHINAQSPTDRHSVGESVLFGREYGEEKKPSP